MDFSEPDWSPDDGIGQPPVSFALNATVYGLTPGHRCVARRSRVVLKTPTRSFVFVNQHSYAIVRFDSPDDIPSAGGFFNSSKWAALFTFTAPAETVSLPGFDTSVMSSGMYFYRVVDREGLPLCLKEDARECCSSRPLALLSQCLSTASRRRRPVRSPSVLSPPRRLRRGLPDLHRRRLSRPLRRSP